jgi:type IV pilus assembly protein PilE
MKKKILGFTLIEMMITVAIIGIIAAIAYPSYMASVRKTNRAEAKTELMDIAQRLQRCYTTYGKFNPDNDRCSVYVKLTAGDSKITTRGDGYYDITISNNTATTYTLTATAVKAPQLDDTVDGCNIMTLDHKGVRMPAENCW